MESRVRDSRVPEQAGARLIHSPMGCATRFVTPGSAGQKCFTLSRELGLLAIDGGITIAHIALSDRAE
ncbi:MAG TPA: hypothetical protein VNK46_08485 [Nitrospiraceae bacterium]|jgi:hypothetical protein|nr:hypothetical protein [Nitrospiraceae bacterium]